MCEAGAIPLTRSCNAPVFVVGCDRSGTTLLRLMLNQHSRIAMPPSESYFITHLLERRHLYGDLGDDGNLELLYCDLIGNDRYKMWQIDDEKVRRRMFGSLRSFPQLLRIPFELYMEREGKVRWGDKTPKHVQYLPCLDALFPDARFVHIVRDGRDVAASLKSVPWFRGDVVDAANFWKRKVEAGRRGGKALGARYFEVDYEDLVRSPEETLRNLCQYIGEEFESEMLDYYKTADKYIPKSSMGWHRLATHPVSAERSGRWRRDLARSEIELFELVAGETLEAFGYDRVSSTSPRSMVILGLLHLVKGFRSVLGRAAGVWRKVGCLLGLANSQ